MKMEIEESNLIRVVVTLQKIRQIQQAIETHQSWEEPDGFAVQQWEQIKNEMQQELLFLISEFGVKYQTYEESAPYLYVIQTLEKIKIQRREAQSDEEFEQNSAGLVQQLQELLTTMHVPMPFLSAVAA